MIKESSLPCLFYSEQAMKNDNAWKPSDTDNFRTVIQGFIHNFWLGNFCAAKLLNTLPYLAHSKKTGLIADYF